MYVAANSSTVVNSFIFIVNTTSRGRCGLKRAASDLSSCTNLDRCIERPTCISNCAKEACTDRLITVSTYATQRFDKPNKIESTQNLAADDLDVGGLSYTHSPFAGPPSALPLRMVRLCLATQREARSHS